MPESFSQEQLNQIAETPHREAECRRNGREPVSVTYERLNQKLKQIRESNGHEPN